MRAKKIRYYLMYLLKILNAGRNVAKIKILRNGEFIVFRQATSLDRENIYSLCRKGLWNPGDRRNNCDSLLFTFDEWINNKNSKLLLATTFNNTVIGCVRLVAFETHVSVDVLRVHKDYRRLSIAKELLNIGYTMMQKLDAHIYRMAIISQYEPMSRLAAVHGWTEKYSWDVFGYSNIPIPLNIERLGCAPEKVDTIYDIKKFLNESKPFMSGGYMIPRNSMWYSSEETYICDLINNGSVYGVQNGYNKGMCFIYKDPNFKLMSRYLVEIVFFTNSEPFVNTIFSKISQQFPNHVLKVYSPSSCLRRSFFIEKEFFSSVGDYMYSKNEQNADIFYMKIMEKKLS